MEIRSTFSFTKISMHKSNAISRSIDNDIYSIAYKMCFYFCNMKMNVNCKYFLNTSSEMYLNINIDIENEQ